MPKYLMGYLLVTGIGAFVALAAPSLVIIGLFMLIIPGLILGLMPSAFMYGLIFAAGWMAARTMFGEGFVTVAAGLAAVLIVATTATKPTRMKDFAVYRASILPDVNPSAPIELKGDIRFNFASPRLNEPAKDPNFPYGKPYGAGTGGYQCDNFCLAALFTPGVTSVTVDKSGLDDTGKPSIEARTYRLVPRSKGCTQNLQIDIDSMQPPLPPEPGRNSMANLEDGKATVAQWALRLDTEFCLVMEPALPVHDIIISASSTNQYSRRGKWAFGPGSLSTTTVEIRAGQKLVYRSHQSSMLTMAKLLFITPSGGLENFGFGWERSAFRNKSGDDAVSLVKSLAEATNLQGRPISGASSAEARSAMLPQLRKRLAAALDNPAATDRAPAFQAMETYFSAVGSNASPEDLALISRLVADSRLTQFRGIWNLKLPLEQARTVYDAYSRRLTATGGPAEMQNSYMDKFVAHLGRDAHALIGPLQKPLLDDEKKRLAVPELVRALGYSDARNGINLVNILRQHSYAVADIDYRRETRAIGSYGEQKERDANIRLIEAAKTGLCLMAPRDADILRKLEEHLNGNSMPRFLADGNRMMEWQVIMVRMGKPIETVEKPANMSGTVESYRRQVQDRASKWRPDRC